MTPEERKELREERKRKYYKLYNKLDRIKYDLSDMKSQRGHTKPFKQLMLSIEGMQDQIREDHNRFEKRLHKQEERDVVKNLQQSLNRERTKREELEKKIKEASESSGLFIKYVRDKLKF